MKLLHMRKTKDILNETTSDSTVYSFRLQKSLIAFLDKEVKAAKVKNGTRNKLVEGILTDWAKKQGYLNT